MTMTMVAERWPFEGSTGNHSDQWHRMIDVSSINNVDCDHLTQATVLAASSPIWFFCLPSDSAHNSISLYWFIFCLYQLELVLVACKEKNCLMQVALLLCFLSPTHRAKESQTAMKVMTDWRRTYGHNPGLPTENPEEAWTGKLNKERLLVWAYLESQAATCSCLNMNLN